MVEITSVSVEPRCRGDLDARHPQAVSFIVNQEQG